MKGLPAGVGSLTELGRVKVQEGLVRSRVRIARTSWEISPKPLIVDIKLSNLINAGFRSSSQGQINSAVAVKEHSRVRLFLGLAIRSPDLNPLDYLSALDRTGEDDMPQRRP
ncbi:unnamed protein product [Nezara viridula]|uniref:Uncharacterized protein n=1 Tax=Nezara viridula TaxID=85310 RepID=A0A9P0E7H9_NEZVI|nr:unnamed protein product [Nezara viridula]